MHLRASCCSSCLQFVLSGSWLAKENMANGEKLVYSIKCEWMTELLLPVPLIQVREEKTWARYEESKLMDSHSQVATCERECNRACVSLQTSIQTLTRGRTVKRVQIWRLLCETLVCLFACLFAYRVGFTSCKVLLGHQNFTKSNRRQQQQQQQWPALLDRTSLLFFHPHHSHILKFTSLEASREMNKFWFVCANRNG